MAPCGALFAALAALPAASAGLPEVTWSHGEWQPFVPEKETVGLALDLDLCSNKATFSSEKCPAGTAVACWSPDANSSWLCFGEAFVGPRAASGVPWEVACMAEAQENQTLGACTFGVAAWQNVPAPLLPELMPWEDARAKAQETLERMSLEQKTGLLQGIGWTETQWWFELARDWYVGNSPAYPELGVPSLNMQDASDGFRTYWSDLRGTVTVWPSILAMAATWDPVAVQDFAVAVGKEFAGKGANVILGPGVQVQRVARNGRSFEYLAGEDPYLGAHLTKAYVKGVQSQGVMAVMKHFVFNSQETNRGTSNSVVDNKTARELYFPPFEAAIEAGVGAAMCSYNRVDGEFACSNQRLLNDILKEEMGFQGFVQSDWWAVHQPSLMQGLDQEMPGAAPELFLSHANVSQHPERVDEAAGRILAAIYKTELPRTSSCAPPNCSAWMQRTVTSSSHKALAKKLAADSVVMLKNGPLPIDKSIRKLAVIGSVAIAESYDPSGVGQGQGQSWHSGDFYSGGGSGHLTGFLETPLDAILARARLEGIEVIQSPSDNVTEAQAAAAKADLALIFAGATSGESVDRADLNLANGANELIASVAEVSNKTAVLLQICGSVVMPWHQNVSSILAMFLGGEGTAHAWASLLFGDASPSGRLPVMVPETEADTIPPSEEATIEYSEGLATSYRNPGFRAAYPFGHGLSYSQFRFSSEAKVVDCPYELQRSSSTPLLACVKAFVQNTGARPARTVPQLYLDFPAEAGQTAPILKGFQKTSLLQPGATAPLLFPLTARDLSYYSESSERWVQVAMATAIIADSAADRTGPTVVIDLQQTTQQPSSTTTGATSELSGASALSLSLSALLGLCFL